MLDNDFITGVITGFQTMSMWEVVAVILALAYLLLAMKEKISCWYAAFASTSIYVFLFWDVNLLMESALQIYYLAMAVYGWWQWREHSNQQQDLTIHRWTRQTHLKVLAVLVCLTLFSGYWLQLKTSAALPYLDSFTTWGAVITTYMVTRKVLENWLYWIVIDGASIYLYIDRGMSLTALLFALYVVIVVFGFFQWNTLYKQQSLAEK